MEGNENLKVIKTGFLQKRSKIFKFWNSRFCILTETYFYTYKGIEKNSECTNAIALSAIINIINSENDYKNSFLIKTNDNISYYFIASDDKERNEWIHLIKETKKQNN
jgi:hypothetical protein